MIVADYVESSGKHEAWSVGRTNALPRVACERPIHKERQVTRIRRLRRKGDDLLSIMILVRTPRVTGHLVTRVTNVTVRHHVCGVHHCMDLIFLFTSLGQKSLLSCWCNYPILTLSNLGGEWAGLSPTVSCELGLFAASSACGLLCERANIFRKASQVRCHLVFNMLSRCKSQCPSRHASLSPNFSLQSGMLYCLYRIRTTRVTHSWRSLSLNVASKVHRAATPWVLRLSRIAHACRECRRKDASCSFPDPQPNSYSNGSLLPPLIPADTSETPTCSYFLVNLCGP